MFNYYINDWLIIFSSTFYRTLLIFIDLILIFRSSLSGKKSNVIMQGSLNSIKYMASTITRKLDVIKGAISANTTPVKTNFLIQGYSDGRDCEDDYLVHEDGCSSLRQRRMSNDLEPWGRLSESRKSSYNNLMTLGEHSSNMHLNAALIAVPDNLYSMPKDVSKV